MSDLKKWRVTGPDGFERIVEDCDEYLALHRAHVDPQISPVILMRQAGYRAEPIEEPKMVTVRAEDVATVVTLAWGPRLNAAIGRLRAALDGAK